MKTRSQLSSVNESVPVAVDSKWLYGQPVDLIIGCAAWSAPLLLLAYFSGSNYPQGASIVFYMLALVFNYPHYMATIYRAYRTREDFDKYKIFTVHLTLLVLLLLVLAHVSYQLLALTFTLYLTWSPFHYTGQNFGIALMFARRNGVKTTREERWTFYTAFVASYAMFFLAVHSGSSTDQFILTLGIPLKVARIFWSAMLVAFIVSAASSISSFVKQTNWRAMTAPIVLLSTQVVWFVIPTGFSLFSQIDFLQARSTTGMLAIMHSAQYLWITSYYARREAQSGSRVVTWKPLAYFGVLVLGGIALFVPGPWLASRVMHIDFTASFLAFTALVNIHHFLLDGAIWKLRDGRISSLLLQTSSNVASAGSTINRLSGWLTGRNASVRMFRVAATLALLLLAGLDQTTFYYGAQANDKASLQRAERLNPYDATVQLRLARASERDGNQLANREALEEAVRLNPYLRSAQTALAKQLIESREYQHAYSHYQRMFTRLEPDVDSLVNFGLLASQLGRPDEAMSSWERALAIDANQSNAHLYLADALVAKEKYKDAIPHYQRYVALVANESSGPMPSADVFVRVVLQLADTCDKASEDEMAIRFFWQAATLAQKMGDQQALTFALVHAADIKGRHGKRAEALNDFQRALSPKHREDFEGSAGDWFRYGKFLQQSKSAPRLFFACFLKSQSLLEENSNVQNETPHLKEALSKELKDATTQIEPATVNATRGNLPAALQEALAWKGE